MKAVAGGREYDDIVLVRMYWDIVEHLTDYLVVQQARCGVTC